MRGWSWIVALAIGCGPQVGPAGAGNDGSEGGQSATDGMPSRGDGDAVGDTGDVGDGGGSTTVGADPEPPETGDSSSGGESGVSETGADSSSESGEPVSEEFEGLVFGEGLGIFDSTIYTFTRCGPQTELQASGAMFELATTADGQRFGIAQHDLVELLGDDEQSTVIPSDPSLEEISWPVGAAWDTTRDRVVLVTLGGQGYTYAYDPATSSWAQLSSLGNRDFRALTYRADADVLYAFGDALGSSGPGLFELGPEGNVLDEVQVTGLPDVGITGQGRPIQLRWHNGELLILLSVDGDMQMYSADPETGVATPTDCR